MLMKPLIAANWKMNKNVEEAISFIDEFKELVKNVKNTEIVIFPAFTSLCKLKKLVENTNIKLGAQNMHFEEKGAFTGEVSALMLKDFCEYVILGHSERREFFNEDNFLINKKLIAALNTSLRPILCVGEDLEQRKKGKTKEIIENQLKNCLKGVDKNQILKMDIAYEPIWAISKGNPNHKAATAEDAEEGHKLIRNFIKNMFDEHIAKNIRIIYGGSMKPENARELLSMPDINGGLVGNASLDAKSFAEVCGVKI
ncbi:MAG: triose-phosphate isomerase [Candidatus Woesearchaeota archaeon]